MLQWFANLSFRRKIALPILLLAVLLLLVGALGVHGIAQLNESNQRLGKRFLPGIALLLNADRDLYQAFVAERSLLEGHLSAEQIAGLRNDHAENLQQALDPGAPVRGDAAGRGGTGQGRRVRARLCPLERDLGAGAEPGGQRSERRGAAQLR